MAKNATIAQAHMLAEIWSDAPSRTDFLNKHRADMLMSLLKHGWIVILKSELKPGASLSACRLTADGAAAMNKVLVSDIMAIFKDKPEPKFIEVDITYTN